MSGLFQTGFLGKLTRPLDAVAKINPLNKFEAKIDPLGDMAGVHGRNAEANDPLGKGFGLYGYDSAAADAATAENNRVLALQQGTDPVSQSMKRTSALLTGQASSTASTSTLLGQ